MVAAREVLATKGIVEATVNDFIQPTGMAHGTFYVYFKDKYDILLALYSDATAELLQEVVQPHKDWTTFERIRAPIALSFDYYRRNIGILRAIEQVHFSRREFHEIEERFRTASVDRVAQNLEASLGRGRARPINPRMFAFALHSMVARICMLWMGHGIEPYPGAREEDVVNSVALFVYRGVFAKEPADVEAILGLAAASAPPR
jgi:AcrR family transcriptional regulator